MDSLLEPRGLVFAVIVVVVSAVAMAIQAGSDAHDKTASNFRAACAEAKGNAVWNGKYWECLK